MSRGALRSVLLFTALSAALPLRAAPEAIASRGTWVAFAGTAGCRAMARAEPARKSREVEPYVSVVTRDGHATVYLHMSRAVVKGRFVTLIVGKRRFSLVAEEYAARSKGARSDDAIIDAMRGADRMVLFARDWKHQRFSDAYDLSGAPTAIDAAIAACA